MRYSKPPFPAARSTPGSNVIPFPKKPLRRPTTALAGSQQFGKHADQLLVKHSGKKTGPVMSPIVHASDHKPSFRFQPGTEVGMSQDMPTQVHQQRAVLEMAFRAQPDSPERADEVAAWTVRQVLRRAGQGEAEKTWLPLLVRRNLDLMCACRHPVGLILRDWLDGNRRFLPANFQTLVEYSTCVEESE
jgi:hypothetical protein